MKTIIVVVVAAMLSSCGLYVHRGGGSYTFIGPGSTGVAQRCDPNFYYKGW